MSERLAGILTPWRPGPCPITIEYCGREATGALTLDGQWSVRACRELLEQLEAWWGATACRCSTGAPGAGRRGLIRRRALS